MAAADTGEYDQQKGVLQKAFAKSAAKAKAAVEQAQLVSKKAREHAERAQKHVEALLAQVESEETPAAPAAAASASITAVEVEPDKVEPPAVAPGQVEATDATGVVSDLVVTLELSERTSKGREMVEGEEDVQAVNDAKGQVRAGGGTRRLYTAARRLAGYQPAMN